MIADHLGNKGGFYGVYDVPFDVYDGVYDV